LTRETGAELRARIFEKTGIDLGPIPNFRTNGKRTRRQVLRIIASLQRRDGVAAVTEAGIRCLIWQDTGCLPGKDTIKKCIDRLELDGVIGYDWLAKGADMPDGGECKVGVRLLWHLPPDTRDYKRAMAAIERRELGIRRKPISGRRLPSIRDAIKRVQDAYRVKRKGPLSDAEAEAMAPDDAAARRLCADLMAQWSREDAQKRAKPPS
jgi:hypothetical protein